MHISLILSFIILENRNIRCACDTANEIRYKMQKPVTEYTVKPLIRNTLNKKIVCEWLCLWFYRSCFLDLVYKSFKYTQTKVNLCSKIIYYDLSVWCCNVLNNDLISSDCFYSHQCNACISKFADTNNYCNWLQVH